MHVSEMRYLKLQNAPPVAIEKDYFTIGYGQGYDVSLPGDSPRVLFSLRHESNRHTLYPGDKTICVNGKAVRKPIVLNECDRIEWDKGVALYLDNLGEGVGLVTRPQRDPLDILKRLLEEADSSGPISETLQVCLSSLIDFAGAETGNIVCESHDSREWVLLASCGTSKEGMKKREQLVSHTLLDEAIRTRKAVYIESIIGHRWESQLSIMEARVFSVACIPLIAGSGKIFGALFLYTQEPGRSIRKEALDPLSAIATHIVFLISKHTKESENTAEPIVYDPKNPNSRMRSVTDRIAKLSKHDLSILIRGETGTGKELAAKDIHRQSTRSEGPYVAINCAAIPPSLMESLLFGHTKGAFTGATKDKAGKFQQAHKGTLFLDEIGDLSLELQTKLLRVLQEKQVEPIGAERSVPIDVRILSATHQDLEQMVREGRFRKDLYYRLNGATVTLPNLRDRGKDEIRLIAYYFLNRLNRNYNFSLEALHVLESYSWPGNVRELEQVVSRAVALASGPIILASELELTEDTAEIDSKPFSFEDHENLKEVQERFTNEFVQRVLVKYGGNRLKTANMLGISERTLYRLLAAADKNAI